MKSKFPRWIAWCVAFPLVHFVSWLPYYYALYECKSPVQASCYPKSGAFMMATIASALYGLVFMRLRFAARRHFLDGDEEPPIAEYKYRLLATWADPEYYSRFVAIASFGVGVAFVSGILATDARFMMRFALAMIFGPGLIMGIVDLTRFLNAVTEDPPKGQQ